jgi:hypothetical protein
MSPSESTECCETTKRRLFLQRWAISTTKVETYWHGGLNNVDSVFVLFAAPTRRAILRVDNFSYGFSRTIRVIVHLRRCHTMSSRPTLTAGYAVATLLTLMQRTRHG